jgi:hypothetical protein
MHYTDQDFSRVLSVLPEKYLLAYMVKVAVSISSRNKGFKGLPHITVF